MSNRERGLPVQHVTTRRVVYGILAFIAFVALAFGLIGGCKEFGRYQKRADAHNEARSERLRVEAIKARAEQRYQEAVGIKRAQDEINSTLTPLYVQHEAIQAIKDGGADVIYVPAGEQGIPMVNDVSGSRVGER